MPLSRISLTFLCLAGLAACDTTPRGVAFAPSFDVLDPQKVRSGLSAAKSVSLVAPKAGKEVSYALPSDADFPFDTSVEFDISPNSGGYSVEGNFLIELPSEALDEIVDGLEMATGQTPDLRGNNAVVPISAQLDRRMRATASLIMSEELFYEPHDCFMVMGLCKSGQYSSTDGWLHVIVNTTERNGRFYSETRLDPELNRRGADDAIEISVYSVDKYGIMIDHASLDLTDPEAEIERTRRTK